MSLSDSFAASCLVFVGNGQLASKGLRSAAIAIRYDRTKEHHYKFHRSKIDNNKMVLVSNVCSMCFISAFLLDFSVNVWPRCRGPRHVTGGDLQYLFYTLKPLIST
jgi:hypothetical protein